MAGDHERSYTGDPTIDVPVSRLEPARSKLAHSAEEFLAFPDSNLQKKLMVAAQIAHIDFLNAARDIFDSGEEPYERFRQAGGVITTDELLRIESFNELAGVEICTPSGFAFKTDEEALAELDPEAADWSSVTTQTGQIYMGFLEADLGSIIKFADRKRRRRQKPS